MIRTTFRPSSVVPRTTLCNRAANRTLFEYVYECPLKNVPEFLSSEKMSLKFCPLKNVFQVKCLPEKCPPEQNPTYKKCPPEQNPTYKKCPPEQNPTYKKCPLL